MSTNPVERAELELAHQEHDDDLFVHPLTGEAIDLVHAPDDQLAMFLEGCREHEHVLRDAKRIVSEEALRRMDNQAQWTLRAGKFTLKGSSPQPVEEFAELELREELLKLVDEGKLAVEAVDKAIEPVVTYKARKAGLNALRKLGGQVAEIIDAHARQAEKRRYVTVERAR